MSHRPRATRGLLVTFSLTIAALLCALALPIGASAFLPDARIYEQVSPPNKEGNFILPGVILGTNYRGMAEAGGNGVLYISSGAVKGKSSTGEVQYVTAKHVNGVGWENEGTLPRQQGFLSLFVSGLPILAFTPDFSSVAFQAEYTYSSEEPLHPEGSMNLYLSSNPLEQPQWLGKPQIPNPVPTLGENGAPTRDQAIVGVSANGTKAFFASAGTLLPQDKIREPERGPKGERTTEGHLGPVGHEGENVEREGDAWGFYESNDGVVSEAGELPDGSLSPYGAMPAATAGVCGGYTTNMNSENADGQVNEEGTKALFVSPQPETGAPASEPTELYVREETAGGQHKSVLASRNELNGGAPAPQGVNFWNNANRMLYNPCGTYAYGSPDGSHVIFSSFHQLSSDGPTESSYNLYPPAEGTMTFTVESATGATASASPVAYSSSSATIAAALEALPEVGSAGVTVTGPSGPYNAYVFAFHAQAGVTLTGTSSVLNGKGEPEGLNIQSSTPNRWYEFDTETEKVDYMKDANGIPVALSKDGSHVMFYEPQKYNPETFTPEGSPAVTVWNGNSTSVETITQLKGPEAEIGVSRASEDGSVFSFQTRNKLPQFNNGGHREIYRYAVASKSLTCVSCPPPGVNPTGDAETPNAEAGPHTLQQTRVMSADGSRFFFDSPDALVGADVNGQRDVYEWENGNVFLISSGTSTEHSVYFDNSASGSDVFFFTEDGLVPGDKDATGDVYDARVPHPGDYIEPSQVPCEGDVCQGPPSVPQLLTPAASAVFNGLGNIPAEETKEKPAETKPAATKCKAGFVKKNGKCVKKKKPKKKGSKGKKGKKAKKSNRRGN